MAMTDSENVVQLDIAGITVALEIADAVKRAAVRERYLEFITTGRDPRAVIRVEISAGAQFIPMRPGPWIIETSYDRGRLKYRSHCDAGQVEVEGGTGVLEIAPEADVENFLRVLYAHLCLREGGLLLHAAGVVHEGAGFIFFGPSGSGKSTASRLSLDKTILSDDLVIIRIHGDEVRAYGVPFRGDFPEAPRVNMSAALRGLFALVKAPEHAIARIDPPGALARLLACVPFVMIDAAHARRAVEICAQVVERVPVRALRFRPDSGFWKEIYAGKIPGAAPSGGDAEC
jgi:hypothetical protein